MAPRKGKSNKNPPILSHEFVIQNHADIVSCVVMLISVGLMFQATSPIASKFISIKYNVSTNNSFGDEVLRYTYGWGDVYTVLFYFLICIIAHAVIQDYILDKINRKLHLSKVKHSKFNESGQLLIFYLISCLWAGDIVFLEHFVTGVSQLWEGFPQDHNTLPFMAKLFFIIQFAYWLHCYPVLYFQRIKRAEMWPRVVYSSLHFLFILGAYILNFNRMALCFLAMHYIVQALFHLARLCLFVELTGVAFYMFMLYNVLFVLARLGTITLSVLAFWYGLQLTEQDSVDVATGNFNTWYVRFNCLVAICWVQAWMMWNFITFHLRKFRERNAASRKQRPLGKRKAVKVQDVDQNSLPEVDQNAKSENNCVRVRSSASRSP